MKYVKYIIGFVACILIFVGCASDTSSRISLSDSDIGLRSTDLKSEAVNLKDYAYISTPAGESKVIERSFENAPPMISHDVEGMMDITKDFNACIDCHGPQNAVVLNVIAVPKSHTFDTFSGKQTDEIVDSRYNCNLCHSPQVVADPVVNNNFKAQFRSKDGNKKSNLIDVINEGVN